MRAIEWIVAIGATAVLGICWGQNPDARPTPACSSDAMPILQSLWTELRALRGELLEDRRTVQQAKLWDLEKRLRALQEQQRELDQEQSSRASELAEIETRLQQPDLQQTEREDLEGQKNELSNVAPGSSMTQQNALSQREARVRSLLAEQEQRVQALEQLSQEIKAGGQ